MHRIKELALKELREIEESNSLNSQNIDSIVKLTKIIKNIDTIHAMDEAKYSQRGSYDISNDRYYEGSHDGSYAYNGMSNAVDRRGRNADGSYRMRNDGGRDQRYSYDGYSRELKEDLEHLKKKVHGREKEMLEGFIKEL